MKFHYIKSETYPDSPSVGVSPKLQAALGFFYKIARMYLEECGDDVGNFFNGGWFVDEPSGDLVDRLDMMGGAVASFFDSCSFSDKKVTCYVIPGVLDRNYYLLFTGYQDREKQEEDIIRRLHEIVARAAGDILHYKWTRTDNDLST